MKVLIEQPLGINLTEPRNIVEYAKSNNSNAYVALNRRFYSSTKAVMRKLDNFPEQRLITVLDQEDTKKAELYSVGSEIFESSK